MIYVLTYFALTFFSANGVYANCVRPLGTCSKDCDCCGHGIERVLCETRNPKYGPRCYRHKILDEPCEHHLQCASQLCQNGFCKHKETEPVLSIPSQWCSLMLPTDEMTPIDGHVLEGDGYCPCDVTESSPAGNELQKLFDENLKTFYSNNYAIGSGFVWKPSTYFPFRAISLQARQKTPCLGCAPGCIKIESRCGDEEFSVLHESEIMWEPYKSSHIWISRPNDRRIVFDEMRVTFPCLRGGFSECTSTETCENYPMQISQMSFSGLCKERNLCPVEIISTETLVGTYSDFQPSCPVCDHGAPSPIQNDASKAFDGTASEYINYVHQNSGVVVQIDPKKPLAGIRLYPGSSGIEFDPSRVEVKGSNDDGNSWSSIFIFDVGLPEQRNDGTLSHFWEWKGWYDNSDEEIFNKIRIKFPQVRGPLDESACQEGEQCRDYPIAIGEVVLYTWC